MLNYYLQIFGSFPGNFLLLISSLYWHGQRIYSVWFQLKFKGFFFWLKNGLSVNIPWWKDVSICLHTYKYLARTIWLFSIQNNLPFHSLCKQSILISTASYYGYTGNMFLLVSYLSAVIFGFPYAFLSSFLWTMFYCFAE